MLQTNIMLKLVTLLHLTVWNLLQLLTVLTELVCCHPVSQLECKIQESVAMKEELQKQYASLGESLKKVEAEQMVLYLVHFANLSFMDQGAICNHNFVMCRSAFDLMEMKRRLGLLQNLQEMSFQKNSTELSWSRSVLMIRYYCCSISSLINCLFTIVHVLTIFLLHLDQDASRYK